MAKMQEVYGYAVDPATMPGRYGAMMVDHLFGTVWTDETLDVRDRRLLTIGVVAMLGQADVLDLQFSAALARGELTEAQVREAVVHLTHYIGWPRSLALNATAEAVIARRAQAAGKGDAEPEEPRR